MKKYLKYNGKFLKLYGKFLTLTPPAYITFTRPDNEESVVDKITDLVWIARGNSGGVIYNSVTEGGYDFNTYSSPTDTEWNWDGWTDTTNVADRNYDTIYNTLGGSGQFYPNILGAELVVHLITDNRYFKIQFSQWTTGGQGGGFSYTREEIKDYLPPTIIWTYFTKSDYGSEVDVIIPGSIELTRGNQRPIYNTIYDEVPDGRIYSTPANTEWNSDGWADMPNVTGRTYQTLFNAIGGRFGNYLIGKTLVMHSITDDRYFRIQFSSWTTGSSGGGFSYKRSEYVSEVSPVPLEGFDYFQKLNNGSEIDYITDLVWITRGNTGGAIFNSYSETYYSNTSPADTEWNWDGWTDLSNVTTRTYDTLYNILGGEGSFGYNIGGARLIMHAISENKYYQIVFLSWSAGNSGGGFSYYRKEVILDPRFKLEITTTSINQLVTIPHYEGQGYVHDYIVDWGDGTPISYVTGETDTRRTHEYVVVGGYTLVISGTCESFYVDNSGTVRLTITKILQFGSVGLKTINFYGCSNLTSIGSGNLSNVIVFSNCFSDCTSLTSIPSGLFNSSINAIEISTMFSACVGLTLIPSGLFNNNTKVTNFSGLFQDCTSLTSIPSGLFNKNVNVIYFTSLFYNCSGITTIPDTLFTNCTGATDFQNVFYNCTSLVGYAPEIWSSHQSATGTSCFYNDTTLSNYPYIPVAWGGLGQVDTIFRMEITTISPFVTITLPHAQQDGNSNPYSFDYIVDWGDSTPTSHVTVWNDPNRMHQYSNAGVYTMAISGICESFNAYNDSNISPYITKVINWGNTNLKQMSFRSCYNLYALANDNSNSLSMVGDWFQCFYLDYALRTIPPKLFAYVTGTTYLQSTFQNCTGLTSIPSTLFDNCPNLADLNTTFSDCYGLTSIPNGLFTNNHDINSFYMTFYNCNRLTSIPSNLFDSCTGVTNFQYTFGSCSALTITAPALWLRTTPGLLGDGCFMNDTLLTNYTFIPANWGGLGQTDTRFNLKLTTTSSSQSITIPHLSGYTYDYMIDYGDNSSVVHITSSGDTGCTHVYTSIGTYTISISGTCETFYVNNGAIKPYVTDIVSWGNVGLKSVSFYGCSNLNSIPIDDTSGLTLITNFKNTFRGCSKISSIPIGLFDFAINTVNLEGTFKDCVALTSYAPELWLNSGITGTNCYSGCTGLTNFSYVPVAWGGLGTPDNSFRILLDIVIPNTSITIPQFPGGSYMYDYIADFGDGSSPIYISEYGDTGCTHNYVNVGIYILKISGTCETFFEQYGTMVGVIVRVLSWGNVGLKEVRFNGCYRLVAIPSDNKTHGLSLLNNMTSCFTNCTALTVVPVGLFYACTGVTDFYATFAFCSNLTSFPAHLFDNCPDVISFNWIFFNCSKLSIDVPVDLFKYNTKVTNFNFLFYNCQQIKSIPSGLFDNCPNVISFEQTFYGCLRIPTIPNNLFDSCTGVTSFVQTFNSDASISTIPVDLFKYNTKVSTFQGTFQGCMAISSIPTDLFKYNVNVDTFVYTFNSSTGLTTIPSGLFDTCTGVTDFTGVFNQCNSLLSIPVDLFKYNTKVITFMSAFQSCSSLSSLPTDLFRYNTKVYTFQNTFYFCTGLTEISSDLFKYNTDASQFSYTFTYCALRDIPADLFKYNTKADRFNGTFNGCSSLTGITTDLFKYNVNVLNFSYTFTDCTGITSVPVDLFRYCTGVTGNYSGFYYTFQNCLSLSSIPTDLFRYNTKVNSFYGTFWYCFKLSSIPTDLFRYNTLVTDFTNTFYSCRSLPSIPTDIFKYNTNVTSFQNTFNGCLGLISIPTDLFSHQVGVTLFSGVFQSCTGITSIPSTLFDTNTNVTDFTLSFYSCTSLTGNAPTLWTRTSPIPTGTQCFRNDTNLTNYASIPSGWK